MSHPNIMAVYDVGHEEGWDYLVLEYIPGQNLHEAMAECQGPLPVCQALTAIRGALKALAYAHDRSVIHRDLKPENIMVTPEGQVKVTDFGLALARGDVRLTQEGMVVGTVLYMAPEVIGGEPADVRSDLYAVGAVLYELLVGRPPFDGEDLAAILSQILSMPLLPPRTLQMSVPSQVDQVVVKLLSKEPGHRYACAEEVLAALPGPAQAEAQMANPSGAIANERASLSLVERIVRSSSTAGLEPGAGSVPQVPRPGQEPQQVSPDAEPLAVTGELLVYAALEDLVAVVESERRHLAALLSSSVIDPLGLLLSQASIYEQMPGLQPMTRTAVSVLSSLARQVLQQVRDLEENLLPSVLESLGLESALEALANRAMRAYGLQVALDLERLPERLEAPLELALFRTAQDLLEHVARRSRASTVTIYLRRDEDHLIFGLSDDGQRGGSGKARHVAFDRQWVERLGGTFEKAVGPRGHSQWTIRFALDPLVELTPREMEVIQWLAEGLSNKEIAGLMAISPRTVNFHLDNIYSKLGVRSRTEAAVYALRHGWVRRRPLPGHLVE
jgi:serine/threonine protein kinase/DNA-binding NarL/FixJ family response regulator